MVFFQLKGIYIAELTTPKKKMGLLHRKCHIYFMVVDYFRWKNVNGTV